MSEFERFLGHLQALLDANEPKTGPLERQDVSPAARPGDTSETTRSADAHPEFAPGDAIEGELARPARRTAVVPLHKAPAIEAFRKELIDGIIRADTANQILRLANRVIAGIRI